MLKEIITIFKICLREKLSLKPHLMLRINEPAMAMDFEDQVRGFEMASAFDGPLASVQCFAAYNASRAIKNSKKILELGCGTGHVVTKIAFMNPDKHFIALDLSQEMLNQAQKLAKKMQLTNIEFELGDMTDLSRFESRGIDAVTSSLAFHHLRSLDDLIKTFKAVSSVIGLNGAFSFYDLGKIKFTESINDLISLHKNHLPVYKEDTINSYLAAFTLDDFKKALKLSQLDKRSHLTQTKIIHSFMKANTELMKLDSDQESRFKELFHELSTQNKFLFYVLRLYFS